MSAGEMVLNPLEETVGNRADRRACAIWKSVTRAPIGKGEDLRAR